MNKITSDLKTQMSKELSNELGKVLSTDSPNVIDFLQTADSTLKSIDTNENVEEENLIRRKLKKSEITDLLSNKKTKMNLPIGKLTSIGKNETKEATASGSGGGYVGSLFTTSKKEMTEKWSQKYKDSIDCENPKGFSQRAHCQGKKKQQNESEFKAPKLTMFSDEAPKKLKKPEIYKTETKEATGSGSAGAYETPAAWAKSTKKKDWRGKSKTLFPGGKFVQVKKKCKTFPYCNQGDIKALNLTNEQKVSNVITKMSEKYNLSEDYIRKLIIMEYRKGKV
jgi:hypothetical protein